eukprot:TRINITY_DN5245_c3_g1_i1.p1 TRINITY_DN5245_c3_g1~~TRINITY_DN5245_c3_g1_i1.p1  ORF type:complete len:439 (-),score=97.66 TRINITY_DN5245_c3_g1_i1:69-1385(-)
MSLLCLVWSQDGKVSLSRQAAAFCRDFPSGFERDLRLRPPSLVAPTPSGDGGAGGGRNESLKLQSASSQLPAVSPMFLCRHAAADEDQSHPWTDGLAAGLPPHPIPLVKSSLQKAVRRGEARAAVAAAAYLLAYDPKELLRRLPIVLVEDVGIFEDLPELTWLMVAVQSGYVLRKTDVRFVLSLVAAAAMHPERTPIPEFNVSEGQAALARLLKASSGSSGHVVEASSYCPRLVLLSNCLALRACYGGMGGDACFLLAFAAHPELWDKRIAPPALETAKAVALADEWIAAASHSNLGPKAWAKAIKESEQVEAAVDFHCSDILQRWSRFLQQSHNCLVKEEDLKSAMWRLRSSLNFREPAPARNLYPVWWNAQAEAELSNLSKAVWAERKVAPASSNGAAGAGASRPQAPDAKKRKTSAASGGGRQLSIFRFAAGSGA